MLSDDIAEEIDAERRWEERGMSEFERELTALLNRHSMENASNTPDFILAGYLIRCHAAFAMTIQQREAWYGRHPLPPGEDETPQPASPMEGRT